MGIVTIIGSGNGAFGFATWLTSRGYKVVLTDFKEFKGNLLALKKQGFIEVEGEIKGRFPVTIADNIGEAVKAAKVVLVVMPAFAHQRLAREIADFVKPGTRVILNPGRTGGALEVYRIFQEKGVNVPVAETRTLLFACRKRGPTSVRIEGIKKVLDVAVMPACETSSFIDNTILKMFPMYHIMPDVRSTDLNNMGAMLHPAITVLNACRIERREEFKFYYEGTSPSVGLLLERLDNERRSIAQAWEGVEVLTIPEILNRSYSLTQGPIDKMVQENKIYSISDAPDSLNFRFITEDVPTGLVPLEIFGRMLGVHTPLITAIIEVSQALLGQDFRLSGRNLKSMGLDGKNLDEIVHYIRCG